MSFVFFKFYLVILFIYLWLCWVFVSVRGLSLVVASGGHSSSRCAGLSLSRPLLLLSTGSRRAGSVVVAYGLSRSTACGIFPDQGSNPCPLHWQADSQPLRHQGSPCLFFFLNQATLFCSEKVYDPHSHQNQKLRQHSELLAPSPLTRERYSSSLMICTSIHDLYTDDQYITEIYSFHMCSIS